MGGRVLLLPPLTRLRDNGPGAAPAAAFFDNNDTLVPAT